MGGPTYEHDPYKPGVALAGRVPVKVSLENGPIEKGDYLTSSSTPGVAMKATKPGQVVGKALEPFGQKSEALNTKSETNSNDQNTNDHNSFEFRDSNFEFGRILVFVNVSYADPNDFFASLSFDNDGYLIIPKIKAGKLVLDSSIASQSATLSTNYQLPTTNYYNLSSKLASIEDRLAELEKVAENTSEVESPNTSEVELSLTTPDILLATGSASLTTGPSATLADLNTYSDATVSGMLVAYQAQIQDHFKVLGETILGNTLIAGDLTVDGTLSISGNSINALSTLYLQSSILAEGLDIFNGKVTIDKEGNISASTITLDQIKVRSGQSQGLSKILAGQTQNLVENPLVEASSIIFVNPKSQTEQTLAVSEKKQGGFLVKITHPEPFDIDFEYLTVRVKP
ncbi:hypothetical protein HY388_00670 [Candidatus Daviesbacteria bacterium]|nr:hypothetical protein [Candidatus Daviesbacteria bacterium]